MSFGVVQAWVGHFVTSLKGLSEAAAEKNTVVTLKIKEIFFFLSTSVFLTKSPARRQQWWPKRHPLSTAEANKTQLD
jgi:hypothetical protein